MMHEIVELLESSLDSYMTGLVIDCIAMLIVIANAIADWRESEGPNEYNYPINAIGIGILILVILSLVMRSRNYMVAANVMIWGSAIPAMISLAFYFLLYILDSDR